MPSIRLNRKCGFNVQFSPFFSKLLACATSENYGIKGSGYLLVLENDESEHLKVRKCSHWKNGLLDVVWMKQNENLLLTSSCDGSILLWSLFGNDSASPLRVFKEHNLDVSSVDSIQNYVVSGSWDSTIKIWDVNKLSSVTTLKPGPGIVHSVKWSHSFPNLIMSISEGSHLDLWDKSQPRSSIYRVESQNSESLDCDWCHTNTYELVVSDNVGFIRIWDIRYIQRPRLILRNSCQPLAKVRWSPHHSYIVGTASYNLSTCIWDVNKQMLLETVRHHSGFILGLDFNKNIPCEIADCGMDSLIHVFTPWSLLDLSTKSRFFKNKL